MKKVLVYLITIIILSSCSGRIRVKSSSFIGVIFNTEYSDYILDQISKEIKRVDISQTDIEKCENLIKEYVQKNVSLNSNIYKYLPFYKRQYVGYLSEGEKIVFVNFLMEEDRLFSRWKRELLFYDDGGDAYFQLTINLTKEYCTGFNVNGEA